MLISYTNGQTSIILRVKIRQDTTGASPGKGMTGLTNASTGLIIGTVADNESASTAYTSAGSTIDTITTLGTYAAPTSGHCRFKQVDATNHPGVYEIQIADARFAVASAKSLLVSLSGVSGMMDCDVVIPLQSVNPYSTGYGLVNASANVVQWNGSNVAAPATAGIPDVNVKNINNVAAATPGAASGLALVGSNMGTVTSVTGSVGSISGVTFPTNFGSLAITAGGIAKADVQTWLTTAVTALVNGWVPSVTPLRAGTAQAGGASTITLDAGASATNNLYDSQVVYIYGGTGAGQTNTVSSYVGATKVATMISAWATNPDATSTFIILPQGPISATVSGNVTVGGYAAGQDPATLVLGATASSWNTAGTIGAKINTAGGYTIPTTAQIATGVWTDTTAGDFTTALSIGKSVMNGVALGTGLTVNALTNLPSIPNNWLTAAGIAAAALNDKGDWLLASSYTTPPTTAQIATGVWQDTTAGDFTVVGSIGKSLFTSGNAPGAASGLALVGSNMGAVASVTGSVGGNVVGNVNGNVVGSVGSITGVTFPTNFSALLISAGGHISNVDTLTTYTGDTPQTGDSFARLGAPAGASVSADIAAVKTSVGTPFQAASAPTNFSSLSIDTNGRVRIQSGANKNVALNAFAFVMTDSTTHAPKPSLTVTATRSLDGGAFAACANAVTEVGSGVYVINLAASDTNANVYTLRFTATGADDRDVTVVNSA